MNNEETNSKSKRTFSVRLLLLLAGVAIGVLFSPNTGRANRAWIRQKIDSWQAERRRWQRDTAGKTEYEMGRATGFMHNLGARLGIVREDTDLSDDIVNARVQTEMGENSGTAQIPRLNIDTFDGIVTLRGHVENDHLKRSAEDVAKSVKGVREVINKITVGPIAASR